jgi:very-short-patch-repair endonuclease
MGKVYNQHNQIEARRSLRRNSTLEEQVLWLELRGDQLGHRFRRQFGVVPYILDFYCPKKRLAIEIDGSQHFTADGVAYDNERTNFLQAHRINMIRFTNSEVHRNLDGVLEKIRVVLSESTSP